MKNKLLRVTIWVVILMLFPMKVKAGLYSKEQKIDIGYIEENFPVKILQDVTVRPDFVLEVEEFPNKEPKSKGDPFFIGESSSLMLVPKRSTVKTKSLEDLQKEIPAIIARILNMAGVKTKVKFDYQPAKSSIICFLFLRPIIFSNMNRTS